jgi:hypothetical protein
MSSNSSLVNSTLFELQASLLVAEVDKGSLDTCKEWFTEQHFLDVVEERSSVNRCGYPLCARPLGHGVGAGAGAQGDSEGMFCRDKCATMAREFQSTLLNTDPHSRDIAKNLRPSPSIVGKYSILCTVPSLSLCLH